jgi:hypothetical protein
VTPQEAQELGTPQDAVSCIVVVYFSVLLSENNHWGDPDVDGRIILGGIFRKWEEIVGTGWSGLRIGTGGGHL